MTPLRKLVRAAEVVTISALSVFAFFTWRELDALRKAPVALPSYHFEDSGGSDETRVVLTRGTWVAENGPPDGMLTTTIECRKARMECVESAAMVEFVGGRGLLDAQHTIFAVERWTDAELVTRSTPGPCSSRQLLLDLKEKRATAQTTASDARGACRERPARKLELVTGYRVRDAVVPAKR